MNNLSEKMRRKRHYLLLVLLCSIMLSLFTACGSKENDNQKTTYSSVDTEGDKAANEFKKGADKFLKEHQILIYIIALICTVINWRIWNNLVDIEFFSSIVEHYIRKALICLFIGAAEAYIIGGILSFVFGIVKVLLIIALIGAGIYGLYYRFGDEIQEKFSGLISGIKGFGNNKDDAKNSDDNLSE